MTTTLKVLVEPITDAQADQLAKEFGRLAAEIVFADPTSLRHKKLKKAKRKTA